MTERSDRNVYEYDRQGNLRLLVAEGQPLPGPVGKRPSRPRAKAKKTETVENKSSR